MECWQQKDYLKSAFLHLLWIILASISIAMWNEIISSIVFWFLVNFNKSFLDFSEYCKHDINASSTLVLELLCLVWKCVFYYKMRNLEGLVLNDVLAFIVFQRKRNNITNLNILFSWQFLSWNYPRICPLYTWTFTWVEIEFWNRGGKTWILKNLPMWNIIFLLLNDGKEDSSSPFCSMRPESLYCQYKAYFNSWNLCGSNAFKTIVWFKSLTFVYD